MSPTRIIFLDESYATTPRTGQVIVNNFWMVHPDKGLAFALVGNYVSPQCNADERIARIFEARYPGCEVKQIPLAFPPERLWPQADREGRWKD